MLGLGLRRTQRSDAAVAATQIGADLSGAVINGQVAIGEHIVQIHAEHGAIVNYRPAAQRAMPRVRPVPIALLPRAFDALVGRDALLSDVHSALARGGPVELVGKPGIGKTSLLRNVSHHLAELQPHGVVYTAVRGVPASDVLQFLFESFYDLDGELVVATSEELSRYLGDRRALIAVDDSELDRQELQQVMDVVASSTFLWACVERKVWGEGESFDVNGLDETATITLLERELGRPLASEEGHIVLDACRALEGSPLRILQFAGLMRAGVVGAGEITKVSVELATARLDQLLARELSDADRRVISSLAAVEAPVPIDAIAAATRMSDAAERLSLLEESHIVESHSPRYSLAGGPTPGLISTPGRNDATEQAERARAALIGLFAAEGPDRDHVSQRFGEPGFLLALVREAEHRGSAEQVLTLAHAGDRAFALSGRWGAWSVALHSALDLASARGLTADEAWALHQLGSRALGLGDREAAVRQLSRALELREAIGDRAGAAVTRHNLDLLSGPPPPDRPPRRPRPRPPLSAVLLIILMLLVGVGVTIAVAGSGQPASSGTTTPPSTSGRPNTTSTTTPPIRASTTTPPITTSTTTPPSVTSTATPPSATSTSSCNPCSVVVSPAGGPGATGTFTSPPSTASTTP